MILFNGATGGLGRYIGPTLEQIGLPFASIKSRLEDRPTFITELSTATEALPAGSSVVLLQLAAMVSVPRCEEDPEKAWETNVTATAATVKAFLQWAKDSGFHPGVVYVSSGHVYSPADPGACLEETALLGPRSVYAKTKLAAEESLAVLAHEHEAPLVIARVFGLVAPDQAPNYLLPAFVNRARRQDVAEIPGLSNVRDYLDARDVARHLVALAGIVRSGVREPIVVNVCSGEPMSVRNVLEVVIQTVYEADTPAANELIGSITEAEGRPTDVPWLVGCPAQLLEITGREAISIPLGMTVRDAVTRS